jgi:hypothetical protein
VLALIFFAVVCGLLVFLWELPFVFAENSFQPAASFLLLYSWLPWVISSCRCVTFQLRPLTAVGAALLEPATGAVLLVFAAGEGVVSFVLDGWGFEL